MLLRRRILVGNEARIDDSEIGSGGNLEPIKVADDGLVFLDEALRNNVITWETVNGKVGTKGRHPLIFRDLRKTKLVENMGNIG